MLGKGKMVAGCRGCCISAASVRLLLCLSIIRSIRIKPASHQLSPPCSVHVDNPGTTFSFFFSPKGRNGRTQQQQQQ
jgi:hypothetical protein